jgi:hypothetical protein
MENRLLNTVDGEPMIANRSTNCQADSQLAAKSPARFSIIPSCSRHDDLLGAQLASPVRTFPHANTPERFQKDSVARIEASALDRAHHATGW